ncbi:hypothetical protein EBZ39_09820 [bacterium]|nr:hypothetical protein [bacterium]
MKKTVIVKAAALAALLLTGASLNAADRNSVDAWAAMTKQAEEEIARLAQSKGLWKLVLTMDPALASLIFASRLDDQPKKTAETQGALRRGRTQKPS